MQEIFYKVAYMFLYVAAAASRAPYAQKIKKIKVKFSRRKLFEIFLMIPVSLGLMILPLIAVFSGLLAKFHINLPVWLRLIGLFGFAFAVFLHAWTHYTLKTNWSPYLEIKEKQKLITAGPYKRIRHPMYSAFFLWSIFQGILLSNWLVFVLGTLSFSFMYFLRVKHEEQLMIEGFGKEYLEYMKRTGRLIPKLRC